MASWTIGEIAKLADVTPRTIRYYIELGLLPPPEGLGRTAGYGQEHLERLQLIKRLQVERLSLDEIREELAAAKPGSSAETPRTGSATSSAADYLARLRESPRRYAMRGAPVPTAPAAQTSISSGEPYVGEQWTRVPLSEDIELHFKRRGNRMDPRITRIVKEARRIIDEEEPR
jgi:DNA-binding transcriptional MerR regulator